MYPFNGFATQTQSSLYFQLSEAFIQTLIRRIIKIYRNQICQENSFIQTLQKLYKSMIDLQTQKHSQPKYSRYLIPLFKQVKVKIDPITINQQDKQQQKNKMKLSPINKKKYWTSKKSIDQMNDINNLKTTFTMTLGETSQLNLSTSPGHILKQNLKQFELKKQQKQKQQKRSRSKRKSLNVFFRKSKSHASQDKYREFISYRKQMDRGYSQLMQSLIRGKSPVNLLQQSKLLLT